MSDRRFARMADGFAHESQRGQVTAARFVGGTWRSVVAPLADLWAEPGGPRERQLLAGTRFCVIATRPGWAYGFDADDGYCGWIAAAGLGPEAPVSHWVCTPGTHLYPAPDFKRPESAALPINARVLVTGTHAAFAVTPQGLVPASHLRALGDWLADPVAVARGFLGTPYLWGGNSRAGLDCSGLVQAARRACGLPCPPDGDLQAAMPGAEVQPGHERAGDLIFWKGHVGMISGPGRLIHANATHMAVTEEDLDAVIARIAATGEPVLRRLRA